MKGALVSFFNREKIKVAAVKNISFSIYPGECVGFLGPNGAGKTTTLKMLSGLVRVSSGEALIFDQFSPHERKPEYLKKIGMVMGQRNQLHQDLPAIDSFRLSQAIYQISDSDFDERLKYFLQLFNMEPKLHVPVRKLSLGERMKFELVLAMLHGPELLYLDEPTIGLDFEASQHVRNFLREINQKKNVTIILTSHYVKDIQELCKRVIVINHGQISFDGNISDLDPRIQGERRITLFKSDGSKSEITLPKEQMMDFLKDLKDVVDIKVEERPLEEIFSELYKRS